jgi:hypothetical protein
VWCGNCPSFFATQLSHFPCACEATLSRPVLLQLNRGASNGRKCITFCHWLISGCTRDYLKFNQLSDLQICDALRWKSQRDRECLVVKWASTLCGISGQCREHTGNISVEPRKPVHWKSLELCLPLANVQEVLHKILILCTYRLQMVKKLTFTYWDAWKHFAFEKLSRIDDDETYINCDEAQRNRPYLFWKPVMTGEKSLPVTEDTASHRIPEEQFSSSPHKVSTAIVLVLCGQEISWPSDRKRGSNSLAPHSPHSDFFRFVEKGWKMWMNCVKELLDLQSILQLKC